MDEWLLPWIPTALLAASAAAASVDLAGGRVAWRAVAFVTALLALLGRLATFLVPGVCPVSGIAGGVGVLALFLLVHILVGFRWKEAERTHTLLILLLALLLDAVGRWMEPSVVQPPPPRSERVVGELHAGFVLLAYTAFLVGGIYAGLYLALHRLMKSRRIGFWFDRIPALARLELRTTRATVVGFVLLTVGLGFGVAFPAAVRREVLFDPKVLATFGLWAVYAVQLAGRFRLGWRGARAMWLPLAGLLLLAATYGVPGSQHPFWSGP